MSHAPRHALDRRQQAVRAALAADGLDALIVTALPNVLYLTNFTGSAAIVVLTADRLTFITDSRYVTEVEALSTGGAPPESREVSPEALQPGSGAAATAGSGGGAPPESREVSPEALQPRSGAAATAGSGGGAPRRVSKAAFDLVAVESSYDQTLAEWLSAAPAARVGFEAANLPVARFRWLSAALGPQRAASLVPTEGIVERARLRKDAYEIAALREGARRLSAVAAGVFTEIRAGRTEREVAAAIDWRIRQAGFERLAFDTIVAAGPNGALPHARPGERRLVEGDLVVLDFGGVYDSYCVDLTRTVSVGRAGDRARTVYAAVLEAHDRAIAAVVPGASRFAVDAAARDLLTARGLGEAFGHGTGHGLGIDVHEDPRIARRRPGLDDPAGESAAAADTREAVTPGMVFTIEPGAYLPGWGGVRIEDDVLVTANGVEVLTGARTDLLEL